MRRFLRPSRRSDSWRQQVNSSGIAQFLDHGNGETGFLSQLRLLTDEYLERLDRNLVRPSAECDGRLDTLIAEHASKENGTREVGVIACFHALCRSTATRYLISLTELEPARYLRCVTLASQMNPSVVSEAERGQAESLLRLLAQ